MERKTRYWYIFRLATVFSTSTFPLFWRENIYSSPISCPLHSICFSFARNISSIMHWNQTFSPHGPLWLWSYGCQNIHKTSFRHDIHVIADIFYIYALIKVKSLWAQTFFFLIWQSTIIFYFHLALKRGTHQCSLGSVNKLNTQLSHVSRDTPFPWLGPWSPGQRWATLLQFQDSPSIITFLPFCWFLSHNITYREDSWIGNHHFCYSSTESTVEVL